MGVVAEATTCQPCRRAVMCLGDETSESLEGICDGCGRVLTKVPDAVIHAQRSGPQIQGSVGGTTFAPHLPVPQPAVVVEPEPEAETTEVVEPESGIVLDEAHGQGQ